MCCGDLDPLLDDSRTLHTLLKAHGVRTQLELIPGVLHAFMNYGRMMNEAVECIKNSGDFCRAEIEK